MYEYKLVDESEKTSFQAGSSKSMYSTLPAPLLREYAQWFCHCRWIVVVFLAGFGFLRFLPGVLQHLDLRAQTNWAIITAAILVLSNFMYLLLINKTKNKESNESIVRIIWTQIIFDLIILTGVIHYFGSLETYIPFAYLFHVVLACIFFPYSHSFAVTIIACTLYVACVSAELTGILPPASIYIDQSLREQIDQNTIVVTVNIVSSLGILMVVWYFASYLSKMVRDRDCDLAAVNKRLEHAQKEKTRHMLRTTHELKAPFAAIDANIQLLFKGHCGVLPDKALEVLDRIFTRSRRLGHEIQEMLQLANLRNTEIEPIETRDINLIDILSWCKSHILPVAEAKGIIFEEHLQPVVIIGNEDHMKILFVNLLSNAVAYSSQGGHVKVQSSKVDNGATVVIKDHGIGISSEKLPFIFDEYYRTDEAVRYNKNSSGLGLTIVKHAAQIHKIKIRVESEPDVGTKFTLTFPSQV